MYFKVIFRSLISWSHISPTERSMKSGQQLCVEPLNTSGKLIEKWRSNRMIVKNMHNRKAMNTEESGKLKEIVVQSWTDQNCLEKLVKIEHRSHFRHCRHAKPNKNWTRSHDSLSHDQSEQCCAYQITFELFYKHQTVHVTFIVGVEEYV